MKVSPKVLKRMAAVGVIGAAIVTGGTTLYQATTEEHQNSEDEESVYKPPLAYRIERTVRDYAIKFGIIPPPPPCGMCGMG